MANETTETSSELPTRPVERWLTPVRRFLHIESASGVVLLACTFLALVLANSPLAGWFASIWKTKVELNLGDFRLAGDLGHLVINDGLMAIFFFVIGLEIKREIVAGELRELRKALLPVFAAIGGMVVPAGVYLALQGGQSGQRGWATPMATDIAFVVGFLALFGKRVPFSLKILLLTLAIVDDLGAVLVIAFVYTGALAWNWLAVAAAGMALTYGLNRAGVRSVGVYVLVGAVIWLAVYKSGVHPTVAGVLLGLLTPASAWVGNKTFLAVVGGVWERLRGYDPKDEERYADLDQLQFAAREAVSPLHRLETAPAPVGGVRHHAGVRPCQRRGALGTVRGNRSRRRRRRSRVGGREARGHHPVLLAGRAARADGAARRRELAHARGRGMPCGDRVHDGPVHQRTGVPGIRVPR